MNKILKDLPKLLENPVVCFQGQKDYPLLFFSFLLKKIKDTLQVHCVDQKQTSFEEIMTQLHISFLGMRQLFWFGDIKTLSEKEQAWFYATIKNYKGPHSIAFYVTGDSKIVSGTVVQLGEITQEKQLQELSSLLFGFEKNVEVAGSYFFTKRKSFSLDQAVVLVWYATMLGKSSKEFLYSWFDVIIFSEESLFTLSSLLFARHKNFWKSWYAVKNNYPPVFWTIFWSEQFFRAYWFIQFQHQKKVQEARQISQKLPFSFMQQDWKKHSAISLQQAHQFFYSTDNAIKHGMSFVPELFFVRFLQS